MKSFNCLTVILSSSKAYDIFLLISPYTSLVIGSFIYPNTSDIGSINALLNIHNPTVVVNLELLVFLEDWQSLSILLKPPYLCGGISII